MVATATRPPQTSHGETARRLTALTLGTFTVGMAEYSLIGQLDIVASGLNISTAATGQLVTLFSLTYAIATPILIAALAGTERRKLLTWSFAAFAAANVLSAISPNFWIFAFLRILMAVAAGLIVVTSIASVSKVVPESMSGRGIATVQMGFTASLILGVPLGRILAESLGWRSIFVVMAILAIIAIALLRGFLPTIEGEEGASIADQLGLLKKKTVLLGLAVTLAWLGGYSLFYTYLTPFLLNTVHASSYAVTIILFAFGLASLFGTHIGGRSADKTGHHSTLVWTKLLHVVALAVIPLLTGSVIATAVALIVWSLMAWASAAPQQMRISAIEPEKAAMLIGLNQSTMQLAIAAGAGLGGVVINTWPATTLPIIGAVVVLFSLILMQIGKKKV